MSERNNVLTFTQNVDYSVDRAIAAIDKISRSYLDLGIY